MAGSEVRRQLGVGLIYGQELDPLLDGCHDDIAVVELEPQTLWEKTRPGGEWTYVPNQALLDRVASFPLAKLMHGIGQPVGGVVADPVDHLSLLKATAEQLQPAWVSEHLSFNRVDLGGMAVEAGFLLPPQQQPSGVRVAAGNIRSYGTALGRPVAFETGVNYLRAGDTEMSDGQFWREVADGADCGVLLDLHNLWCNELNGRASVMEVIDQLPLERVWEVHLAGGMAMSGYWLDAHSGRVPEPLLDVAAEVIPRLPNLGALLFELLPEHFDTLGLDGVDEQVGELAQLWALRRPSHVSTRVRGRLVGEPDAADLAAATRWEQELYQAVVGRSMSVAAAPQAQADPGIAVYRELVRDFRRGNLAQTMRHTMTLLLLRMGAQGTSELLESFFSASPPESYRAVEAHHFACFLQTQPGLLERIRHLREVVDFEHALTRATVFGEDTQVTWTADPVAILQALQRGEAPPDLPVVPSSMLVSA